jgi:hypothetical protein
VSPQVNQDPTQVRRLVPLEQEAPSPTADGERARDGWAAAMLEALLEAREIFAGRHQRTAI